MIKGEALFMTEKAYEKHAWILLIVGPVIFIFLSFSAILVGPSPGEAEVSIGMTWDELVASNPDVADWIRGIFRTLGISVFGWSIFAIAIAGVPYRKGERWAWYVLWYLPVGYVGFVVAVVLNIGFQSNVYPFLVFPIVALLGLILPYRKFFPKS